jgi:precorrin-6B methylase 1
MREDRLLRPPMGSHSVTHSAVFAPHSLTEEEEEARDAAAAEAEQDDTFEDLGLADADHDEDDERLTGLSVSFSEDENHTRTLASPAGSTSSRMSVASMLAMKRERIERQRHETVLQSASFSETSNNDKKIDRNRTLTMIKSRSKSNLQIPAAGSLE